MSKEWLVHLEFEHFEIYSYVGSYSIDLNLATLVAATHGASVSSPCLPLSPA